MNKIIDFSTTQILNILKSEDVNLIQKKSYALSSIERIRILQNISSNKSLSTLSRELNIPSTSLARHIDILAEAKLVSIYYKPGLKGHTKYVTLCPENYSVILDAKKQSFEPPPFYSVELPVGLFSHCHIKRPCGMLSKDRQLFPYDIPNYFFNPERFEAECIWFDQGFVSYNFPTPPRTIQLINYLQFLSLSKFVPKLITIITIGLATSQLV